MTMAPRGRPRKPGRSDVAMEHMVMMGFKPDDISRELKALLKIYGEDGWLFIESDAYKVLIEALLEAQEKEAQPENGHGNELEEEAVDNNVLAFPEASDAGPSQPQRLPSSLSFLQDIAQQCQADTRADGGESGGGFVTPLPNAAPDKRRNPCYGWICDDDDGEAEILVLNPAVRVRNTFDNSTNEMECESKRKSRWDVAPDVI